eukprot:786487-Pelagomonas_calceolata.AAC.2
MRCAKVKGNACVCCLWLDGGRAAPVLDASLRVVQGKECSSHICSGVLHVSLYPNQFGAPAGLPVLGDLCHTATACTPEQQQAKRAV